MRLDHGKITDCETCAYSFACMAGSVVRGRCYCGAVILEDTQPFDAYLTSLERQDITGRFVIMNCSPLRDEFLGKPWSSCPVCGDSCDVGWAPNCIVEDWRELPTKRRKCRTSSSG